MSMEFQRFDVVSDHSDHHFAGTPAPKASSNGSHKKIMKEWKILENDMPESIYVRVYETRVDLLRAAIVGAQGTPYHDGLFFFDVYFPPDYPARPPAVQYRSFGLRVNPNLYACGKVCLSLLNTWAGKKVERWDPKQSTLLQVLLSIQALVLNEKPYFNEPGYSSLSGRSFGEKKSLAYNYNIFILNCKTMQYLLRRPPMHFEHLVTHHLKSRAEFILRACDAYRKRRVQVGQLGQPESTQKIQISNKFKGDARMGQVFESMVVELGKAGASVEHFEEQIRKEKEEKETELANAKKVKEGRGVGRTIVKKLKKILSLGWMNSQKSKTLPVPVHQVAA